MREGDHVLNLMELPRHQNTTGTNPWSASLRVLVSHRDRWPRRSRLMLYLSWLPVTVFVLLFSFKLLYSNSRIHTADEPTTYHVKKILPKDGYEFYAALPDVVNSIEVSVVAGDARPEIIRQFLSTHDSPFIDQADTIIKASDKHGIDFRLITAIAMCESNLGKKMPAGSYNAWGFAIYTGQSSGANFTNWEEAIYIMAEYLWKKYYSKGLVTPEEIGPIYAPPSVHTGNSWANCVRTFMDELS